MTNLDLVKLADELEVDTINLYLRELHIDDLNNLLRHFQKSTSLRHKAAAALRRLASSEGAAKGEPEPVAWQFRGENGKWMPCERPSQEEWRDEPEKFRRLYLAAPPADAGMREAFIRVLASLAAAISILERTPKAKKAVASDKMFDTMLDDYRKALEAGRRTLTAPGATTKSDGGGEERR